MYYEGVTVTNFLIFFLFRSAGDCWLLAVISSMADIPALFEHVAPPGQVIDSPDYVGLFRFRFWRFGDWQEVLVDDRLPVRKGTNQMLFMHSDEANEMWSALMEKAYAKWAHITHNKNIISVLLCLDEVEVTGIVIRSMMNQ